MGKPDRNRENWDRLHRKERAYSSTSCVGSSDSSGKPNVYNREYDVDIVDGDLRFTPKIVYNELVDKQRTASWFGKEFESFLRDQRFRIDGYKFKFTYTQRDFEQANEIPGSKGRKLFHRISETAKFRLNAVLKRLRTGRIEPERHFREGKVSRSYRFIFEWQDLLPLN